MRACIQRVTEAKVTVGHEVAGEISEQGFVVLLGVEQGDSDADLNYMIDKVVGLRVFEDEDGKMNRSIVDAGGSMLVVSQFTLLGDCRRGKRPSFVEAAGPDVAESTYEKFVDAVRQRGVHVECGRFRTHMRVQLVNDGPVTILLDSRKRF